MTRPPPNPNHAVHVLAWMTLALVCYFILTSCSGRPGRYDASLVPPADDHDNCAYALTEDGDGLRLCSTSRKVCRHAVSMARRYGRSWVIRPAKLRLARVSGCANEKGNGRPLKARQGHRGSDWRPAPGGRLHDQKVELR